MSLMEVDRTALVAFAPDAPLFAAGTMAGAVDISFSSSANLEIYNLDFQSDALTLSGAVPSSEPFNRLTWGKSPVSGSEEFELGLIAGGLVDGDIGVWNPKLLISSEGRENALVQQLSRHKGPVRGLEFSSLSPNHLASGAEEGEICIWDFAKPTEPTRFPPLKGNDSSTHGEISFLSWNKKVQPILASTSSHGTTVVWDLRKQKPIIRFSDSVRRRCSVLQWHPDFSTHLVVASDDDNSPSLRIWDMRNTMSPLRELVGHTKGVVAMSWCPHDSSYLLTCAKDNRTICWDTNSAEIVSELPAGTNWNFDVHWYPKLPGVISASSFDGKIGIYNIEACARYGVGDGYSPSGSLRAPNWYQRKTGVTFGFGGKLVSFHATDFKSGVSQVDVHDLVTEHSLVSTPSELEDAMRTGERSTLRILCDKKTQESKSEDDKETWGFLKVMFEEYGTERTKLLHQLGFSLPTEEVNDLIQNDLVQGLSSLNLVKSNEAKEGFMDGNQAFNHPSDNGEDFFNSFPSPRADTPMSTSYNNFATEESVPYAEETTQENDLQVEIDDPSYDDSVQRALIVGDYQGAVAQCIAANKMADALVIAQVGGASLWETTLDQYFKRNTSPYLKVVAAMVNNDLVSLVNIRPLKSWKETLALLCTFAQGDEWTLLCDTLASRLMTAGNTLAASLCYICSGNIDRTVEIWSKKVSTKHEGKSCVDLLQDLMEKTVVLAFATGQKKFSASLRKLIEKFAEILASQGLLSTAMEYLKLIGTDDLSPELVILRDWISHSSEPDFVYSQTHTRGVYDANQQTNPVVEPHRNYYEENFRQPSEPSYNNQDEQPRHNMFVPTAIAPNQRQNHQPPEVSYNNQYEQMQRSMFGPSSTTPSPPSAFNQAPAARPFVPSTPRMMINADQYQRSATSASQLYPVNDNSNNESEQPEVNLFAPFPSPVVPTTRPKSHQVLSHTPTVTKFIPVSDVATQGTTSGEMQPNSAIESAVALATPPATVQTADVSNVPALQKPVIATLTRLFNETSEMLELENSRGALATKREIDDISKKIGDLFAKLNSADISKNVAEKLVQLCQAVDRGDFPTALEFQNDLVASNWDECNSWIASLKRMITTRQKAR
uniref:protein transport protein SEC31 homolog B-like isoform X2 n=1 Tax=Erigeron canadensis TaxID=72917 RepID=UPI001CB9A58C|nr:protein transport protein SEC31 homolog B-like isoform X2 [Erigeron canadensis]